MNVQVRFGINVYPSAPYYMAIGLIPEIYSGVFAGEYDP